MSRARTLQAGFAKAVVHVNNRIALDGKPKLLVWLPGERSRQRAWGGETGFQCGPFFYFCVFLIALTHNFSKITVKS